MNKLGQALVAAHPTTGELITRFTAKDGSEYGKIRVDEMKLSISNGFSRFAKRTAFITVEKETADILEQMLVEGQPYPMPGKIIVMESLDPFYPGQEPKRKGADGEFITHNGHPVYRNTEFVADLNAEDVFIIGDSVAGTASAGIAVE